MGFKWQPGKCCGCEKPVVDKCDDTCAPVILNELESLKTINNWPCELFAVCIPQNEAGEPLDTINTYYKKDFDKGGIVIQYKVFNNIKLSDSFVYKVEADHAIGTLDRGVDGRTNYHVDFPGKEGPIMLIGFPLYFRATPLGKNHYARLWNQYRVERTIPGRKKDVYFPHGSSKNYNSLDEIIEDYNNYETPFLIPCIHYSNLADGQFPKLNIITREINTKSTWSRNASVTGRFILDKNKDGTDKRLFNPDGTSNISKFLIESVTFSDTPYSLNSTLVSTVQQDEMLCGTANLVSFKTLSMVCSTTGQYDNYSVDYKKVYNESGESNSFDITDSTYELNINVILAGRKYVLDPKTGAMHPTNKLIWHKPVTFRPSINTITVTPEYIATWHARSPFAEGINACRLQMESVTYKIHNECEFKISCILEEPKEVKAWGKFDVARSSETLHVPPLSGATYPYKSVLYYPSIGAYEQATTFDFQSNITASIMSSAFNVKVPLEEPITIKVPVKATFSFTDTELPRDKVIDGERYHLYRYDPNGHEAHWYVKLGLYNNLNINNPITDEEFDLIATINLGKHTLQYLLTNAFGMQTLNAWSQIATEYRTEILGNRTLTGQVKVVAETESKLSFIDKNNYLRKKGDDANTVEKVPFS